MDAPIRFEYTPRHEDIWLTQRQASRYFVPRMKRYRFWFYLIAMVIGTIFVFNILYSDAVQTLLSRYVGRAGAFAIPSTLAVAAFLLGRPRLGRWAQTYFSKGLEARAPLPAMRFTAGDERLEWLGAHSGSWLSYAAIDRLIVTPSTLGIVSGGSVISLPGNAFGEGGNIGELVAFILARLSSEARAASLEDERIRALAKGAAYAGA